MPKKRNDEKLREQVQRLAELQAKKTEAEKLESRIRKEKQFNRKIELNAELRKLKAEIAKLNT